MDDTMVINVRNRNNGRTGYTIPDQHITRLWEPNETKKIPFGELRAFSYMQGGLYALNNLLVVENKAAIEALNMRVEPEYFYTEEDIRKILFGSYNYDEFADFLDFAPEGAIEIAKDIAVKEQIPDVKKRNMLSEKTGLNISNAIMVNTVMSEDEEKAEEQPKERRVKAEEKKESEAPKRRTAAPSTSKYNVVKK